MCLERLEELTKEIQNIDRFLAAFINESPILAWVKDINGKFLYVNAATLAYFGLSEEHEMIGKTEFDFLSTSDMAQYLQNDLEVWNTGEQKELIETLDYNGYVHHFYSVKFKIDNVGIGGMAIDLNGSVKKLLSKFKTN